MRVRLSGDLLHAFVIDIDGVKSVEDGIAKVLSGEITVESEDTNPGVTVDWAVELDEDGNEIEDPEEMSV